MQKESAQPLLPVVSIVGRPNVGKSCLFNRIIGKRVAVVDDIAGVTRDRNYRTAVWNNCAFSVVDTGGLLPLSKDNLAKDVARQVDIACEEAEVILFVVDCQTGVTDIDLAIARRLRKHRRQTVFLVINKTESNRSTFQTGEFLRLGLGEGQAVSALHGYGVADLLDMVAGVLNRGGKKQARLFAATDEPEGLKVAVVGRPNAGKSSLVNKLIGVERMIVRPEAGTTRDSIDSAMEYKSETITLIDTAGLRKKARVTEDLEYYCNLRAVASIKRCDVAALVIDATAGLHEQDLRITRTVFDMRKGLVLCFNKWDLLEKTHGTFDRLVARLSREYLELRHVPMVAVSALTGRRVMSVLDSAIDINRRMRTRLDERELTRRVLEWVKTHPHPVAANKSLSIFSCSQSQAPFPYFFVSSTHHGQALVSYKRYLANKLYDAYDFDGCPVTVEFVPLRKKSSPEPYPAAGSFLSNMKGDTGS
jgi:GTPase